MTENSKTPEDEIMQNSHGIERADGKKFEFIGKKSGIFPRMGRLSVVLTNDEQKMKKNVSVLS